MLPAALDLLAPSGCAGCRAPGPVLCRRCALRLSEPVCQHRELADGAGVLTVVAAHPYDPLLRALLIAYKERGRRGLSVPLGTALAGVLGPGPLLLVPVPSRRAARRSRGFDHTVVLARAAAAVRPGATVWPGLALNRRVRDSAGLDAAGRRENLHGAVVARRPPPLPVGVTVWVVDDVCTTGTSLAEAARAVRAVLPGVALRAAAVASVARPGPRRVPRTGGLPGPRQGR